MPPALTIYDRDGYESISDGNASPFRTSREAETIAAGSEIAYFGILSAPLGRRRVHSNVEFRMRGPEILIVEDDPRRTIAALVFRWQVAASETALAARSGE
jgi:hypothetical protein